MDLTTLTLKPHGLDTLFGRSRLKELIARTALTTAMLVAPIAAAAQNHPSAAAEFAFGWVGFADDGIVSETLVGGAGRWYVSSRIGIGPEIVYLAGPNHSHLVFTGNVTFDFLPPDRPVTPFLVVGGGLFQTRESFPSGGYTSNEGAFTFGGGVRINAGNRVTLGLDTRVGWETHVRVNGTIGIRLGS
jgi:hypothetical protein